MQKTILWVIGVLVLLIGLGGAVNQFYAPRDTELPPFVDDQVTSSPRDLTFRINEQEVILVSGTAEHEVAPGSASKEVFRIFGEPVMGDLDADGDADAVFFLTQETGGSGTFFYAVVGVNENGTYKGTNAMFLGDRIAPQNINIMNGKAVVNFAERKAGESFATQPSVGKSIWVHLDTQKLEIGEAVQNFEGEADVSRMSLPMKVWSWVRSEEGGVLTTPKKADVFTLTFKDGNISIKTDCNGMGGTYVEQGRTLTFGSLMSTQMYCEGSQESYFSGMISNVKSYSFTGKGELVLRFGEQGIATFR